MITRLSRSARLRRLVQIFRLHKLGNWWLRHFPMVKRLPESGVIYRASRLESIPLANEMFEKGNLYDAALLPPHFTNFADLGCNVGYFTCWLAHLARGRKLRGLMLDANPEALKEGQWHATINQFPEVFAFNGIVGEGAPGNSADFFLYESNICSMSHLPDTEALNLKGQWTKISVPCVSIEKIWREHFGEARCHVLKVDIEGSEMKFLRAEKNFLQQVDSILVEWHKWAVGFDEINIYLVQQGFRYCKTIEENDQMGTACFRRPPANG